MFTFIFLKNKLKLSHQITKIMLQIKIVESFSKINRFKSFYLTSKLRGIVTFKVSQCTQSNALSPLSPTNLSYNTTKPQQMRHLNILHTNKPQTSVASECANLNDCRLLSSNASRFLVFIYSFIALLTTHIFKLLLMFSYI